MTTLDELAKKVEMSPDSNNIVVDCIKKIALIMYEEKKILEELVERVERLENR